MGRGFVVPTHQRQDHRAQRIKEDFWCPETFQLRGFLGLRPGKRRSCPKRGIADLRQVALDRTWRGLMRQICKAEHRSHAERMVTSPVRFSIRFPGLSIEMNRNSVFFSPIGFTSGGTPRFTAIGGIPVNQFIFGPSHFDHAGNLKSQHQDGSQSDRYAAGSAPKQGFNTDWMPSTSIQNIWRSIAAPQASIEAAIPRTY